MEIETLHKLTKFNHTNIIKFIKTINFGEHSAIIMEYAESDLDKEIRNLDNPFPEYVVLDIICQIANVMSFLHSQYPVIIHRDIKPANILIKKEAGRLIVKLGDFGIVKLRENSLPSDNSQIFAGTYFFMSDEYKKGEPYGPSTDIYSLGKIIEILLNREPISKQLSKSIFSELTDLKMGILFIFF